MNFEQDAALSRYLTKVQAFPRHTSEEERTLWVNWRTAHDPHALEALVHANLRHVVTIAFKYRHYRLPISELIAEGNFGIVHAMAKFAPERGVRFVTYAAYWIRAFILRHIIYSWSLVGAGSGALHSKMFFRLRRERGRLMTLLGDGDRVEELLATRFNKSRRELTAMLERLETRDVSLSAPIEDSSSESLMETLVSADNQEERYARYQDAESMNAFADTTLAMLDQRERYVIERRLMADTDERMTLAALGRHFGISRERVRQLEARALTKLKARAAKEPGDTRLAVSRAAAAA
ncbi:MAG TPA: sigma-70 family RNA polymerase sigma factor [Polyangiaceae bacterium]